MRLLLLVPSTLERAALAVPARAGVELLVCGIGVAEAGMACARRLAAGRVQRCLLAGIGGTRDPARAPIGTLVLGEAVRNEALGAGHAREFRGLSELGLPPGEAPPELLPLAPLPSGADTASPALPGVIGTVAAASASPAEAAAWRARHPDVLVEEMEGYAVALACRRAGVPLSILRAISNVAGDRERSHWDLPAAFAALQAGLDAALAAEAVP